MINSKKKMFNILFSIFVITLFVFLLSGCRNKNVKLRNQAIERATVFVQENVDFGITPKTADDIALGRAYVRAEPTLKGQISAAIETLKQIPDKNLTKENIEALTKLIDNLTLIQGKAAFIKVTFDLNGGKSTNNLVVNIKKGSKLDKAEIPTVEYAGYKFLGWELNAEIINLDTFTFDKDVTLVAQWEKTKELYTITLDESVKDIFELVDPTIDLTKLEKDQVVKFKLNPKEHTKITALLFNDNPQALDASNLYSYKVVENITIKATIENITFKLEINDSEHQLTTNVFDINNVIEGTEVILTIGNKVGYERKLQVNNKDILESEIIDNKYKFIIKNDTIVNLFFTQLCDLAIDANSLPYLEFINPTDLNLHTNNYLPRGTQLKFKVVNIPENMKLSKITLGDKEITISNDPDHIYTEVLQPAGTQMLKVLTEKKTFKINIVSVIPDDAINDLKIYEKGTTNLVDITNPLEYGKEITFKISDIFPAGFKLNAQFNDIDKSDAVLAGYDVALKENIDIKLARVSTTINYNFTVDGNSKDYLEFISPTINKDDVNSLAQYTEVKFKVVNIPAGKVIDAITFGSKNVEINSDPNYVYSQVMEENAKLTVTLKFKQFNITIKKAVPAEAINDFKIYVKGTTTEVDLTQNYNYGTEFTLKLREGFPNNYNMKVMVNNQDVSAQVMAAGYELSLTENVEIELERTVKTFRVKLKLNGDELFDAGLIGAYVFNKDAKLATLHEKDFNNGDELNFEYLFYKDNKHIFDGFLIEGTSTIVRNGDKLYSTEIELTLVPNYIDGFYRKDSATKIFYMYKIVGNGKLELVMVGNSKETGTDNYSETTTMTIPQIEYIGTGVEESYTVVSIASNATKHLVKVKKIDLYSDNKLQITSIGENNFNNITTLEYFLISTNIRYIGQNSLRGNMKLKTVIKDNVIYLDNDTTQAHSYLIAISVSDSSASELVLHPNTRIIMQGAFKNMTELTKVTIGQNLKQIGTEAFKDCTNLATINLSDAINLRHIAKHAFNKTLITKEYIQNNVKPNCFVDEEVC